MSKINFQCQPHFTVGPIYNPSHVSLHRTVVYPFKNRPNFNKNILIYIQQDAALYSSFFFWKLLYMFRVVPPPIIRSANNCIYSIWYLSHSYCYLPLLWKSWKWFECAVGGVHHPQHTQTQTLIQMKL